MPKGPDVLGTQLRGGRPVSLLASPALSRNGSIHLRFQVYDFGFMLQLAKASIVIQNHKLQMDKARKPTVEGSRYHLRGIGVGLEPVYGISLTRRMAGFLFIGKVMGTNTPTPIKIKIHLCSSGEKGDQC